MLLSSTICEHFPWNFILALFLLFMKVNAKASDMHFSCPDEFGDYRFLVYHHVTPYGNASAGRYSRMKGINTLPECVNSCCLDNTCNVVFFFNTTCLLIQCQSKEMCQPLDRIGNKFDKTYMVMVRFPSKSWDDLVTKGHLELAKKLPISDNYFIPEASAFEDTLEDKDIEDSDDVDRSDFKTDIFGTTLDSLYTKPKSCVYGIEIDCTEDEECVLKNKRSRSGLCRCKEGYTRSPSGRCQRNLFEPSQTKASSVNTSAIQPIPVTKSNFTTVPVSSTTAAPPTHLVVSAGENVTLHLPDNEVTLSAYAVQQEAEGELKYEWTLLSHPEGDETGTMESQNTKNLKLSKLRNGIYTFKVTVTGINAVGDATVNVTVLPPERPNQPPIAIIQPSNVIIKLPNKETVLDGSFSTDEDDKIVKYQWEVLQEPIGYSVQLNETATLQLKNLIPGFYRLKLIVTDSKGGSNFTFANVTVQKETDYPPTANAKSETVIYLPQNEVFLNGNMSTDDKGIKSWEWKKSADTDKAVDMEGTNSPYLHLSNLQVGVYKFILKVTDTADQTSTTEVHLFVKPESNTPPTAITVADIKVTLPLKNPVALDGSQSKDDIKIVKYHWEQIQGPKPAVLTDADSAIAKADRLGPGLYQFNLTVYDDKNTSSSALLNVTVIQTQNMPPHANAGGDKTVYLPCDVVTMNGSGSTDDVGVVKYQWTRDPASLAAGMVLEKSDQTALLKLTRLISGRYLFRLTVSDLQGTSSSDTASLIVKPPPNLMDQVEVMVNADIKSFTQGQEETVLRQLEMLLHVGDPVKVRLVKLDSDRNTRRVIMVFVVEKTTGTGATTVLVPGAEVVSRLKKKLRTDSALLDLEILSLDTVVCQNQCSGHGSCDQYTKRCICEAFWMQDVFRRYLGDRESNCDWSILYVIIVSFTVVVLLAGVIWGIACCWTRMRFRKPKKRHRYTLLEDFGEREREREKFIPRSKLAKSSLMMSESDSDAIFESTRKPSNVKLNGTPNGLVRSPHKVTA